MASLAGFFFFIILAASTAALHPREASTLCDLSVCAAPPGAGPICAYDASGIARTFRDRCHLETVSCHEGTHYAVIGNGMC